MKAAGFDLLIATDKIQRELGRLSTDPKLIGQVELRLDGFRVPPRFILESMSVSSTLKLGIDRPPLASWGVVAMYEGSDHLEPTYWLERCKPQPSQSFVILLLGKGRDNGRWKAWVVEGKHIQPIHHLQAVGRLSFETPRSTLELPSRVSLEDRWSRTTGALGTRVCEKLRQTTVVLIGCSGVGTQLAIQLAALPIGRLGLADSDQVESHNLARMALATEGDIGRNKAHVLAERILAMRSDLAITVSDKAFGYRSLEPIAHNADIIMTAVDRDLPRLASSYICRQKFIPHLDVGTSVTRSQGQSLSAIDIRCLLPGAGCVSCVGGLRGRERAEYELRGPMGALPQSTESWQAGGRLGSLTSLNAMAAATAIQLWLENLGSQSSQSFWHRIHWDGSTWVTNWSPVESNSECKICKNSFESADFG